MEKYCSGTLGPLVLMVCLHYLLLFTYSVKKISFLCFFNRLRSPNYFFITSKMSQKLLFVAINICICYVDVTEHSFTSGTSWVSEDGNYIVWSKHVLMLEIFWMINNKSIIAFRLCMIIKNYVDPSPSCQ